MGERPQPRLRIDSLTGKWQNGEAGEGRGSEPCEPGGTPPPGRRCVLEGPPLRPGGEDITWPDRVAPGADRRLVPAKSNLKPQTSNLIFISLLNHLEHINVVLSTVRALSLGS